MAKQGKCASCKKRYLWNLPIPLKFAKCPHCGDHLVRSTHQSHLPVTHMGQTPAGGIRA